MITNNSTCSNGDIYVPFEKRTGPESIVFFTRDLSSEGLEKIYKKVKENISGKITIKVHKHKYNSTSLGRKFNKERIINSNNSRNKRIL